MYHLLKYHAPRFRREGGTFRWVLALLLISGCARPQYLATQGSPTLNEKARGDGCLARFKTSNVCVDFKWEKHPTESEFGSFIFTTSDSTTDSLTDVETKNDNGATTPIKIVLWMSSMGHSSSPVTIEKISMGVYRAKKVFFTMKGDWEIRFQVGSDQATYALFL